ncbi:hypothetical protein O181_007637 [Austropuccinia psidii MF-1]|uniref:UDP-N-acetylglucosamine transferase subunit ALG14 n=1 Tax=Austropuccinia psidii MF-1 TaxID=1389203 RepID=A0A9Q3GIP0_9BASI|nr:hypothetical protein [Austropuccinia psidii MF-1]
MASCLEFSFRLTFALTLLIVLRLFQVIRATHAPLASNNRGPPRRTCCSLGVFLGSGGHTGEMIRLLMGLPFDRYTPRTYIISSGDSISKAKVLELEQSKGQGDFLFVEIPRARKVHQSFLTTPFSTLYSLVFCFWFVTLQPIFSTRIPGRMFSEVIILNGPGSSVPIALAAFLRRFITGRPTPRLIYVESVARVKRLSLSGRLLLPFVDSFLVQWEVLKNEVTKSHSYNVLHGFKLVASITCEGWMV